MSKHDDLVERASKAIDAVFSDTSVSQKQTAESLRGLQDEINTALGSLDEEPDDDSGDLEPEMDDDDELEG